MKIRSSHPLLLLLITLFFVSCDDKPTLRKGRHASASPESIFGNWAGPGARLEIQSSGAAAVRYDCGGGSGSLSGDVGTGIEYFSSPSDPNPEAIAVTYSAIVSASGDEMEWRVTEVDAGIATTYVLARDAEPSFVPFSACPF
jgi:hypothetical protein